MLKRLLLLGLVVGVMSLATPSYAVLDANDVMYHPADSPVLGNSVLTGQILDSKEATVNAYSNAGGNVTPPDPTSYYADSHTQTFSNLLAGTGGTLSLDQYDPTRINPNTNKNVGQLRGVLLYLTVHLKGGRLVLDNESSKEIPSVVLQVGALLNVDQTSLRPDPDKPMFSANPYAEYGTADTGTPVAADIVSGPDPFDGQIPNYMASDDVLDQYCQGADKLADIIDPDAPGSSFDYAPLYTELTDPAKLALFVGDGTIDLTYDSLPFGYGDFGGQVANVWPSAVTFDIEARVVYLYAQDAVPEPATLCLLAGTAVPALLRRRRRKISALA